MHRLFLKPLALLVAFSFSAIADDSRIKKGKVMNAEGAFDVKLEPVKDDDAPAGRMIINKTYTGSLVSTGTGQMLSKRTDSGVAVYSAIED